jgi:hypothetical protein
VRGHVRDSTAVPRCRSASRSGAAPCSSGRARSPAISSATARSRATACRAPCAHHVADVDLGEERTFTGNFVTGPADEIYGPYEDDTIVPKPMENALGITPKHGAQITSPDLCGSCHNVLLPVFDDDGRKLGAKYEQSTHLEWTNSDFARAGGRLSHLPGLPHAGQVQGHDARVQDRQQRVERSVPADDQPLARRRDRARPSAPRTHATRCTGSIYS